MPVEAAAKAAASVETASSGSLALKAGSRVGLIGSTLHTLGVLGVVGVGLLTVLGMPPKFLKKWVGAK